MEFSAYPKTLKGGKVGGLQALWRAQGILHSSDNVAIPIALLLTAVVLVTYQHVTSNDTDDSTTRNFLLMILLSMAPLAFLERKIWACSDPVGMISKSSTKVLMMHACFLSMRVATGAIFDAQTAAFLLRSTTSLLAACVLLPTVFGLRLSRAQMWYHRDVLCLAALGLFAAVATEYVDAYSRGYLAHSWLPQWYASRMALMVCAASSDYIEILSFVPAMWMVCREEKKEIPEESDVADAQKRAFALFAFMVSFYIFEDLLSAYQVASYSPFSAIGHVAHFLLLLDFTGYILAHLCDPEKYERLMGKFLRLPF